MIKKTICKAPLIAKQGEEFAIISHPSKVETKVDIINTNDLANDKIVGTTVSDR
jgi:hypothetical protein